MVLQVIVIIGTGFDLDNMSYHSWMSVIIAIIFAVILWMGFLSVIDQYKNESREEVKKQFLKENSFQEMFDGIQEGIIVMKGEKLHFMNELSRKLIEIVPKINKGNKEITGLTTTDKGLDMAAIKGQLFDAKIFYAFDSTQKSSTQNKKKKGKSSTDSDLVLGKQDKNKKTWSLRDIS